MNTLGIFVKHPQPGRVKTRLGADLGAEPAAGLYAAFVGDLFERFRGVASRRVAAFAPDEAATEAYFRELGGADFQLWPQADGRLGERMRRFFAQAFAEGAGRVVLIGSDSPTLPSDIVERAFESLARVDCVIGPATDGGYYLIGMRRMIEQAFDDIAWSGPEVLTQTVRRCVASGCTLGMLPVWYDVDSLADLQFLRGHLLGLSESGIPDIAPQTAEWLDSHTQHEGSIL